MASAPSQRPPAHPAPTSVEGFLEKRRRHVGGWAHARFAVLVSTHLLFFDRPPRELLQQVHQVPQQNQRPAPATAAVTLTSARAATALAGVSLVAEGLPKRQFILGTRRFRAPSARERDMWVHALGVAVARAHAAGAAATQPRWAPPLQAGVAAPPMHWGPSFHPNPPLLPPQQSSSSSSAASLHPGAHPAPSAHAPPPQVPGRQVGTRVRSASSAPSLAVRALVDSGRAAVLPGVRVLERITLGRQLGAGNFGAVCLGDWNGTPVALKTLGRGEDVSLFLSEVAIIATLTHPNVVQFLGTWKDPGTPEQPYMVFEYVSGGDLLRHLQQTAVPLAEKMRMIVDACRGMVFLAGNNLIHRDLACRNLLIDGAGTVKISDFGMSRLVEDYYEADRSKPLPVRWSAPEVLTHRKWSTRSDVYSFGIVMWEIVSDGGIPYPGFSNAEVSRCVREGRTARELQRPARCPKSVYALMCACWWMDPHARPSFEAVLAQLLQDPNDPAWRARRRSASVMSGKYADAFAFAPAPQRGAHSRSSVPPEQPVAAGSGSVPRSDSDCEDVIEARIALQQAAERHVAAGGVLRRAHTSAGVLRRSAKPAALAGAAGDGGVGDAVSGRDADGAGLDAGAQRQLHEQQLREHVAAELAEDEAAGRCPVCNAVLPRGAAAASRHVNLCLDRASPAPVHLGASGDGRRASAAAATAAAAAAAPPVPTHRRLSQPAPLPLQQPGDPPQPAAFSPAPALAPAAPPAAAPASAAPEILGTLPEGQQRARRAKGDAGQARQPLGPDQLPLSPEQQQQIEEEIERRVRLREEALIYDFARLRMDLSGDAQLVLPPPQIVSQGLQPLEMLPEMPLEMLQQQEQQQLAAAAASGAPGGGAEPSPLPDGADFAEPPASVPPATVPDDWVDPFFS